MLTLQPGDKYTSLHMDVIPTVAIRETLQVETAWRFSIDLGKHGSNPSPPLYDHATDG